MAALLEGQALGRVAEEYSIPNGTVRRWKAAAKIGHVRSPKTEEEIDALLVQMVKDKMETISFILKAVRDPNWIMRQSAAELGTFVGIETDKVDRMLSAWQRQRMVEDAGTAEE